MQVLHCPWNLCSVTKVACWKETEMPNFHGPQSLCQTCINQKPTPSDVQKHGAAHFGPDDTRADLTSSETSTSLWACGNLISERGKCVNNRLSFFKVMAIQGRFFLFLVQQQKKCLVSVALYQLIYKGRFRGRTHQIFHCSVCPGWHDTTLDVL